MPNMGTKDGSFQNSRRGYYQLCSGFCACILHRKISHLWAFDLKRKSRIGLFFLHLIKEYWPSGERGEVPVRGMEWEREICLCSLWSIQRHCYILVKIFSNWVA